MEKYKKYNDLLSELFKQWIENYNEEDRERFCQDGLMLKNDSSLNVDFLWEHSPRRVVFMLKDCPDGTGYDTREILTDKFGTEKGHKNRNLKVKFLRNLAKLLYGLIEMSPLNVDEFNDKYVNKRIPEVVKCWNTKPFAFIESKKLAGGKTVSEKTILDSLDHDEFFLKKELDILRPNIIVCCNATGDSIFNFVTQKYFYGIDAIKIGGEYILDDGRIVADMRTCLWYFPSNNVVVIKAFHPSVAANWKVLEKVLSPFRSFIRDINPSF